MRHIETLQGVIKLAKPRGLKNPKGANVCFANATLQGVLLTPGMAEHFASGAHQRQPSCEADCAMCSLVALARSKADIVGDTLQPEEEAEVKKLIQKLGLTPGVQECAGEFFQKLASPTGQVRCMG
jgi:hypothetical protein